MPMNKSFNIPMPNKPYVDDFSENKVQAATYIGPRYLKVQYNNETKYIANVINDGDSMDDLNEGPAAVMEGHTSTVIDADSDTLVAAYLTNAYETGEVADHSEDLGTTDANGDAETWEYVWNDNGVIHQIYFIDNHIYLSHTIDNTIFQENAKQHAKPGENHEKQEHLLPSWPMSKGLPHQRVQNAPPPGYQYSEYRYRAWAI